MIISCWSLKCPYGLWFFSCPDKTEMVSTLKPQEAFQIQVSISTRQILWVKILISVLLLLGISGLSSGIHSSWMVLIKLVLLSITPSLDRSAASMIPWGQCCVCVSLYSGQDYKTRTGVCRPVQVSHGQLTVTDQGNTGGHTVSSG